MKRYVAVKDDFGPEEIAIMQECFEHFVREFRIDDAADRDRLARLILDAAGPGVTDLKELIGRLS